MNRFSYARAGDAASAIAAVLENAPAAFLAGGTAVLDLMKETVEQPRMLVDINALDWRSIEEDEESLRIGALARMSDVADDPVVGAQFPVLAQALRESASPQLRNMASIGGNLMQRTRCPYFRDVVTRCNKRQPGTGCSALEGYNRSHAILGGSDSCIAVHASDLAVALAALDASVTVVGQAGQRTVSLLDFYVLPDLAPARETVLAPGELIAAVIVPKTVIARRSLYLKVRDRASFEFALVSVAAALQTAADGSIEDCRLALGGVAPKPWRAHAAEQALRGRRAEESAFRTAALEELGPARGYGHNAFKIPLASNAVVRALAMLSEAPWRSR